MSVSTVYRHSQTDPVRGREIDANLDVITAQINGLSDGSVTATGVSATLSVYANNAAAVTGGLAVGSFYRTGADPDVVCVVH